jgi:dihydrofolate synthase/folylpolyglutamate synthase
VSNATWPGRFEVFFGSPPVILDGAHNPDGIRTLRQTLDEVYPTRPIVFLFGVLADKDHAAMARILFRSCDRVVVVRPNSQRAAAAADIAREIADGKVEAIAADSIAAGLNRARSWAGPTGIVCVAGSLYMIGEARQLLRK